MKLGEAVEAGGFKTAKPGMRTKLALVVSKRKSIPKETKAEFFCISASGLIEF
jgi:hypothetical protein